LASRWAPVDTLRIYQRRAAVASQLFAAISIAGDSGIASDVRPSTCDSRKSRVSWWRAWRGALVMVISASVPCPLDQECDRVPPQSQQIDRGWPGAQQTAGAPLWRQCRPRGPPTHI